MEIKVPKMTSWKPLNSFQALCWKKKKKKNCLLLLIYDKIVDMFSVPLAI